VRILLKTEEVRINFSELCESLERIEKTGGDHIPSEAKKLAYQTNDLTISFTQEGYLS